MDPDYDIHLSDENDSASDAAKGRFLDSIGITDFVPDARGGESAEEFAAPSGMVLSSMPDDIGFPDAETAIRGWGVPEAAPEPGSRVSPEAISLPSEQEPILSHAEPMARGAVGGDGEDPDEVLNLHCPACQGALVLMRRHLGIEGACVWCGTSIVAAESPQDRFVRVFPINSKTGEQAEIESEKATEETAPSAGSTPLGGDESAKVEAVVDSTSEDSFGSGFSSWTGPASAPASAEANKEIEEGKDAPGSFSPAADSVPISDFDAGTGMPDLDSLYETSGFLAPSVPPADAAPFANSEESVAEVPLSSGFGEFLQNSAPAQSAEPTPDFGFAGPVPWGPPTKGPVVETSTTLPALQDTASTAFGMAAKDEDSVAAPTDRGDSAGFASAWDSPPSPMPMDSPPAEDLSSAFSAAAFALPAASEAISEKPASASADADRSYAPPFHGFSTGSSKDPASSAPELGLAGLNSAKPLSWDLPDDKAPSVLEAIDAEVSDLSDAAAAEGAPFDDGSSIFGELPSAPFPSPFAPLAQSVPMVEAAPSADVPVTKTAPPPLPEPSVPAAPSPLPQVISQPLGAREKPKVRKGFIVLMVMIVGFASGAALASFVLPVDQYVAAARAYMEEKFNPGAAAQQLPALPSLVEADEPATDIRP